MSEHNYIDPWMLSSVVAMTIDYTSYGADSTVFVDADDATNEMRFSVRRIDVQRDVQGDTITLHLEHDGEPFELEWCHVAGAFVDADDEGISILPLPLRKRGGALDEMLARGPSRAPLHRLKDSDSSATV